MEQRREPTTRRPERQEGGYGERLGAEKRSKIQQELAFEDAGRGEAPRSSEGRTETTTAGLGTESQADTDRLMEELCEKENPKEALTRVKANAGAAGTDGMTVKGLPDFLRGNRPRSPSRSTTVGMPSFGHVNALSCRAAEYGTVRTVV